MRTLWLLLLAHAACTPEAAGPADPPAGLPGPPAAEAPRDWLRPFLASALEEGGERGLPELGPESVAEVGELLDASLLGGRIGLGADRELAARPGGFLCSALLSLVESREPTLEQRRAAYALLEAHVIPAAVPRLVLRLKYEKDWLSNVSIVASLLHQGNGAGLEALRVMLASEDPVRNEARLAAAEVLGRLPALPGSQPGDNFQEQWAHLLELERIWRVERRLGADAAGRWPATETAADPGYRQELLRMVARLGDQRLRPVDDARYVLTRVSCSVVPILLDAARDEDRYVREHAYQALAWIGPPVGHWLGRTNAVEDFVARLETAVTEPLARLRAIEAAGGSGLAACARPILPWLIHGDVEERTAAADALLRCADAGGGVLEAVVWLLEQRPDELSDEAHWSLVLLRGAIDPALRARADLPDSERDRRLRWREQRAQRWSPGNGGGSAASPSG